jgi:hypothetical protein
MAEQPRGTLRSLILWLVFPVVPVLMWTQYYLWLNIEQTDPRRWTPWQSVILLGPLTGYGFLAGATVRLIDPQATGRWFTIFARRAVWVTVGPWVGFLTWSAYALTWTGVNWVLAHTLSEQRYAAWLRFVSGPAQVAWLGELALGGIAYGWLIVAAFAARRARRQARLARSACSGVLAAAGFLGSLLGGFWAATSILRTYFFDSRIAQVLLVAGVSIFLLSGCGPPPTVGDIRRRELFQAMAVAWIFGLALIWRWLARERR